MLMIIWTHWITWKIKRLLINKCRSQSNGRASNTMSTKPSATTETIKLNPEALAARCYYHSLNSSIKSTSEQCQFLKDTLHTVCKICRLAKHSAKQEKLLGEYQTTILGESNSTK